MDINTAYKYIDDINGVARLIADDRARLDYEPNLDEKATVLKPNSEYKFSVDMSTLCAKRLLFTGTFDAIQRALPNMVFDSEDIVSLREMMQKRGYEVACGICYVESTRREIGKITQDFINSYKESQKTGKPITRINSEGKLVDLKKTKEQKETTADKTTDKFYAEKGYTPTLADLNTTDIDLVKRDHPLVYEAYLNFMNARGQAKPKLLETRAEYKGEILKHFKYTSAVNARNNAGGLRLQSFSDFEVPHLIDMMQIVMDMSRVGLKSQAYTKVPAFAEVFGNSGVKINLSLIAKGDGLDANGNLVFDDVEGINHKEAFKLRDKYSKNVGTILVGKTDAHIIAAMADPRIDYIIPFHKSSWKESLYDALGLTGYADYTDFQNEKPIDKDRKIKNFDPSEYWDFTKSGDENAQIYLAKCREEGRIPKFPQFQGYPGYWKLLIDFKMYDNDGVGSPQEVVKPIFNTEASERILREYKGGHRNFPVAKDVVEDFVKEHKDKVKYSDRYQAAEENSDILSMTARVESGNFKANDKVYLGTVSEHIAKQIQSLTGINVEGFKMAIEARQIEHILKDHGKNGVADKSMANPSDLAKIEYAIKNYDDIRSAGKTQAYTHMVNGKNKTADTVLYEKAIGEKAYYVVQAVPDTKAKTLYIVTAFIGKKGYKKEVSQLINANSLDVTAKTGSATTSDGIISQDSESVKRKFSDRSSYVPTFYSYMGKIVDDIKLDKMGAGGVVSYLKGKGVKNEEIKWSGIETWLEGKKSVTKAELQEFVAGSQLQVVEQISGEDIDLRYDGSSRAYNLYDSNGEVVDTFTYNEFLGGYVADSDEEIYSNEIELKEALREEYGTTAAPKWEQYKLNGGSNYRELVFQLPNSSYSNRAMRVHWGQDAEGVLAHARVQDFVVDGKKMLFVEELQSDWHNEGYEKGYTTPEYEDAVAVYDKLAEDYANKRRAFNKYVRSSEFRSDPDEVSKKKFDWLRRKMDEAEKRMQDAERDVNALKEKGMGDVPDAPFRSTYHEYVLKRLLRMAAEEGYDSIGWTPADIQSDRWSDEFAEGYRIEYDQDIPKFLRKYGKKWGTIVGKTELPSYEPKATFYDVNRQQEYGSFIEWQNEVERELKAQGADMRKLMYESDDSYWIAYDKVSGTEWDRAEIRRTSGAVWSMSIPDSMKDSVLYEGQVLYQDRNSDSVSNRSLLANALESVAQNDVERNKLNEYKSKIALIESEQAKLAEVRAKIKELSFAKGKRDTDAIKSLQFEANQTANRINTYDRQLLNLESTKALKGVLEREKQMAYKRAERKGKEALAKQREKDAKTQRELLTRYQESRKKGIESRHKTEMRHKIKDVVNELNQYLLKGTKDKHVPIELQKAVAEALDAVNMDTVGAEERIAKKREEMMRAKTPEAIEKLAKEIERIQEMGGNMANKISRLKTAYDSIINSDDPLIANSHDEVIANTIDKVIEVVGNTPLRDMSLYQLEAVHDMYRMILHSIRTANKAFKAEKGLEISVLANTVIADLDGKTRNRLNVADTKFAWNNLKPVYAFERIGSNTFTKLFNAVREGEDVWARDMSEAQAFRKEQSKIHKFDSWDFEKKYTFETQSGKSFELDLGEMMSIYAFAKDEHSKGHLIGEGFVFDPKKEVVENVKGKIKVKVNLEDATAYNLSEQIVTDIIGKLTPDQKAFADAMQDYLSTTMGEKGNEVSLELYEIKLFKNKNYFPLKVAPQYMAIAKEKAQGDVKIKNKGFTKDRKEGAKNPIVLSSFMDVWATHVNEMSMYHAFTLPLEDFYRVFNYKTPRMEGYAPMSVNASIQNAYGEAATSYIEQLLKDLNGGARVDPTAGIINKLTGLFKKSAVFASASVVVQQPSAIARATALVDTKYFVGKPSGKHKETWAEIKKYAPVAIIKEMGYFDTGMGKSSEEWLKGDKTLKDKIDDVASKAPALADELAWGAIWKAVKRETLHTHKDLKPNSDEFLKAVGERFTEVITKTQVYDSVLSRSANMRSKDTGMKMATAFLGEPTTSINMIQDALTQGKRGDKRYARKAIGSVVASMILNSILVSFVYAGRDDDEDKTYAEKYVGTLTEELLDSLNPLTLIPFVKDIVSIVQGYDVERSDMAVITDVIKAWNNLDSDNRSVYRKVEDFAGAIASIFGLPVKNIMRDARGMYNTVNSFINGEQTTGAGIGNAISEAVTGDEKSNGQQLYEAMLSGDSAQIERVKGRFKDQNAINSAIRKALRDNDPRINQAAEARYNGDIAEYMRIAKEIIAEGHFKQDDVVAAINSEISALKKGEETTESTSSDKATSIYKMDDYYAALVGRDQATAYAVKEDLIKTDVANGKDRDEAEADFNSRFASYLRELYEVGELSDYEAQNMLVQYGGKSEEDAYSKVQYWEFKQMYPDYDLSEEAVKKYYNEVEPSGIGVDVYYDYSKQRAKCKGVDANGDGKTDSGSVKSEVLYVIDSLPITNSQKDVLYYLNGWSAKTIYEAPWH